MGNVFLFPFVFPHFGECGDDEWPYLDRHPRQRRKRRYGLPK
eukprot:SAG11_NODE_27056_length_337_cov_1.180672_2_plen_41_part_01